MRILALLLIRIYQGVHLAFFRNCCRFHPSCSEYAAQAIEAHGVPKGILLGSWRILRCQPFAKGGWDPVPAPEKIWTVFPFAGRMGHGNPGRPASTWGSLSEITRFRNFRRQSTFIMAKPSGAALD